MSLSEEERDFLRFVNLVIKVAPNAVRYMFDQRFPAPDLALILQNYSSTLNKLKSSRVINAAQWDLLFPPGKITCSATYDVTLMICLLRNIVPHGMSSILRPATGFDQLPSNTDLSEGADLARVKHYRSFIAHHTEAKIPRSYFNSVWTDLCGAISRLGNKRYDQDCADLRVASLDEQEQSVPKHIREKYKVYLEEWRKDEETFTVTRATDYVANLIEKNKVVVVTGSSGSGKSSIIHHVALNLNKEEGYDIIPFVTCPADIIRYRDINKNQVFVIDDFCGKNFIDELDLKTWINHADKIEKKLKEVGQDGNNGQMKILVSCRLLIFKDEKFKSMKLFTKLNVDLQSKEHCLTSEEKCKMLLQYISQSDFNFIELQGVIKDFPYFPLLCKMSKGKERNQLTELFCSPINSIKNDINDMIKFKPLENCALVLCVLFHDGFNEAFINPRTTPFDVRQKVTQIVSEFDISLKIERNRKGLLDTFKRLDGTYVKKRGPIFHIADEMLYDITAVNCGKNLVELFIEYAPTSFIAERFRFSSIFPDQDQDDSVLYLSADIENLYFDRIFRDLLGEEGKSFFYNYQLREERYKDKVMGYINQNTDYCKHLFLDLDKKGVKISTQNGDYSTPLFEASKIGFYDLVRYLNSIGCKDLLPSAIYRMDERSRELYKRALESGSEIKREIRVLVVGKQGAGKTSLIRRLLSRSLDYVTSTNGIEIHSVLCNENMSKIDWKLKTQTTGARLLTGTIQTENRTTDSRNRTADSRNRTTDSRNRTTDKTDTIIYSRMNQEEHATGSDKEDDLRGNNKLDLNSSNIEKLEGLDESAKKQEAEDAPLLDNKVINIGDSESETEEKENQDLKDIIMADVIDENDIRISIWDFGGDEEFYHTHQVFLAEDVVFLVVTSLVDSAKCSQGELRFWFDTIHCLCKDEGKAELNPSCIVIGTHTDAIESDQDVDKIMEEKLNTVKDLKKHIHGPVHFISNTKDNKDDISKIKMAIIRAAKENKEWQTKHPLKFILLDKALEMMRKESVKKPVVTFDDIKCANKQLTNPLTVDELDLYLRYNHRLGHLIYYTDIPDHIVINPQWLCDIFRYIVTADKFRPDLQRIDWEKVRNTGEVTKPLLDDIFKIEKVDEEHQLYLLKVMEKFHILIRPSMFSEISEKEQCPRYFAPCIIKNKELRDLNGLFKINFNKSTCLCIKCNFLPPFVFNHIIIFFCKMYASAKAPDGKPMFFSNGAIFDITSNMCEKLVVVKQNYIIQLQVLMFGKPKARSYPDIKSRIEQKITHICETFSVKIKDEWKWKCPETSYTNCDGLMEFADCEESLCIECGKLHSSRSYWFENSPSLTRTSILSKGDEEVRKGSLYDLEDNQKRWLLIGIDLHNIIAPALRKYVAPRLNQLWTTLKSNNHIDKQQYPHQLKKHLTTNLNYESINNNKLLGWKQQSRFNYCVKGPVDLSKLFLLPHMAHYTGFDDSCDSSALLGIIINSGICPPNGKQYAEKVRSEIRNKWAHSNFTEWDDTKYQDSLQLIEQLVGSLGLSNEEESEIFSQLVRWKNNGKEFIEGTTPESVALKDISNQIQAMVVLGQHLEQVVQEKIRQLTEKMGTILQNEDERNRNEEDRKRNEEKRIQQEQQREEKFEEIVDEYAKNNTRTMSDAVKEGSLYDLEDNEKRWILIGIDLHKIIAPALRKYVKPRLDQIWQSLKNSINIDAQQYPNQLKSYLTTFLNYEAINNNKGHGMRQQSQYDYSVKDPVDLSKLFLKTDMARYTGFDDSCDSSALLGIVINTGICPPDGKPCAEKVRSEIRNRWAHSNFTEWDDTKYQDSLQLIEQLVGSLGLSKEEENEIFSQLDRWKKNGKEFIEGTTPESVALKDISKQFQTMVAWTKHLEQDIQEKIRELTEKRVKPTVTLSPHEEVLALFHVTTNDSRAARVPKMSLNRDPEVLEHLVQIDAGAAMTDEKIERKIEHQPRYLPIKGYCENSTSNICTLGVVRMTIPQRTRIFVKMILEKENMAEANEVHFPFVLTRQIISAMKEAQALIEKFKDNSNDFDDCLTPRMFARKLFESKFWIRLFLNENGGKEFLKLKEHSIHHKERMVNVPVKHLSDIIFKLEEIAELGLEQFGCEEDTLKNENQKLLDETLLKLYAGDVDIKSFYEQGGNLSDLLEVVYTTTNTGRLRYIFKGRAAVFTYLSHHIVQTFSRSLYDFAKLLIIAVEVQDFGVLALLLSHMEDMDNNDYREILTYGYALNGIFFYIDIINRSWNKYVAIFLQQFTDFILSCCTAETFKIIAHNTVGTMYSFKSYQTEQIMTRDAKCPEYLLRSEKECLAFLLPRDETLYIPALEILDDISNENVIIMLRSILDKQRHLQNNYNLLSVVVGQVSYMSMCFTTCVTQLEWNTVLLSASTSSNYFMVNYILQNKDYRLLKIEEAFISACKAGANIEVIVMLLESFDCNLSLIIEALNYFCQCIPSNKRSIALMLDILITRPEYVEIALGIAFCETKIDVITTVIEFVNLETINLEGVFSFVCRNGEKDTIKHMLSEYDHSLFDLEAALFSASLSHKYENVRMILEKVNISELNFEYLVDCLTKKNALNAELIGIIMKTSQKPLEKVLINKSLEHSPLHFSQTWNMYDWSKEDKCLMLMKACSHQNLDNVKWLFKKNVNNINYTLVLQCINRAVAVGQFHIAKWLIASPGKDHLPVVTTEIAEISIYKMYNIQLFNSLKITRNSPILLRTFTEIKKFMKDEQRYIGKMTDELFPTQVTTTVMASIRARLDSFDSERIDMNEVRLDPVVCRNGVDEMYKGCKRIDWTLNGRFVDVSMDRRLENRYNDNERRHKFGSEGSGMKDQMPARMITIEYLVRLKQTIDHGISDTKYIEIFRNAVAHGDDLCCRLLLKSDKEQLPTRMLELSILESMFYCNLLSDTQLSDRFRNIACAIAWELTRRFYQENKHEMKFKRLYPATKCGCKEKGHNSFCSNDLVLVAEVDKRYPKLEIFFGEFEVKQLLCKSNDNRISKKFKRFGDLVLKRIDQSICINHGVSFDLAENLFKKHSNLVALIPSILRSLDNNIYGHQVALVECVSFYCHLKGYIPFGEAHYPEKIVACNRKYPTDIVQGSFEFASQVIKVGDLVETNHLAGTLGGFLRYYNKDCFLTCAHVVCDYESLISRSYNAIHNQDFSFYVRDQNHQQCLCGSAIRCVFQQGSACQPGIDVAVVKCKKNNTVLRIDQFVKDSSGNLQNFQFLGLKSPYLNDKENIVDYELLTISKASLPTMAFGSQIILENNYTQFDREVFIDTVLNGIGPSAANANGMNLFPVMIATPAHFQHVAGLVLSQNHDFRMYKQMYLNIPLKTGDSGTCIYLHNSLNQQGTHSDRGNFSGCVGMAIAFLNGMSVVTPMKNIIEKLSDS